MITGIGTDIVDIRRIEKALQRFGSRFKARVFTKVERDAARLIKNRRNQLAYYAKRFAAKEACAKALGTGVGGRLRFADMEIINNPEGKPLLTVKGYRHKIFHLSLSDDYPYALAFVVVEERSKRV